MAKYSHLKVFNDFYNLSKDILNSIRNFPRIYKYTLGEEIQRSIFKIIERVIRINSTEHKSTLLKEAIAESELLKIKLRLAKDLNCYKNLNIWLHMSEQLVSILKQLEGWRKAEDKRKI